MKFENFREFLALATARNYSDAAEMAFTTQPSLSRHIKAFEDELGAPLFYRTTRKVELTPLGHMLVPYAQQLVALQEEYTQVFQWMQQETNASVNIGCISKWNEFGIAEIFAAFEQKNPGMHINVFQETPVQLLKMLEKGTFNLAFTRTNSLDCSVDKFGQIHFREDYLALFVSEKHRFAGRSQIHISELRDEFFLLPEENTMAYRLMQRAVQRENFIPKYLLKGLPGAEMEQYLRNNHGIALLLCPAAEGFKGIPGTVHIPIVPEIRSEIKLVYAANRITRSEKNFISFFSSFKSAEAGLLEEG